MTFEFLLDKPKKGYSETEIIRIFEEFIRDRYPHYTRIYTDGSRRPDSGKTGASAVAETANGFDVVFSEELFNEGYTSYEAELHAILGSLQAIRENKIQYPLIICDCQSALKAIRSTILKTEKKHRITQDDTRTRIIQEICKIMEELDPSQCPHYLWIPGHAGIPGSSEADAEAKRAADRL